VDALVQYSCRPWALISVPPGRRGEVADRVLNALEADARAIAPVVTYDDNRLEALFRVELDPAKASGAAASSIAGAVFERALEGIDASTDGVDVVAGGPERLP
jgi:hypothetical protein